MQIKGFIANLGTLLLASSLSLAAFATTATAKTSARKAVSSKTSAVQVAQTATETNTVTTKTAETEKPEAKKLSFSTSMARSNSLNNYQDGTEQASWDSTFLLGYQVSENYNLSTLVERSDDIKNSDNSDWASASLRLTRADIPAFSKVISLRPRLSLGLPITKDQKYASYQGSLGVSLRAIANSEMFFSKKLYLDTALSLSRSFHRFETAESGKVNTQYSSTQDAHIGWNFTDALGLSFEFVHYDSWSYLGAMNEYYSTAEELGYTINPAVSVAVGHQIGKSTVWNSEGSDYAYKLTDDRNSMVYVSVTYTY